MPGRGYFRECVDMWAVRILQSSQTSASALCHRCCVLDMDTGSQPGPRVCAFVYCSRITAELRPKQDGIFICFVVRRPRPPLTALFSQALSVDFQIRGNKK